MPPASWMSRAVKRPPGIREATIGVRSAMRSKSSSVERDAQLVRDRQQMQDSVGRATRRRHRGDGVVDRSASHDLRRASPRVDELHDKASGRFGRIELCRIGCRDPVQAAGTDPEELEGGAHRVRGELAAARAGTGAGRVLDLPQLLEGDLPGPIRADRLEHGHDGRVPSPAQHAWIDRAVVQGQARQVEAGQRHRRARQRLVAADQAHETVEEVSARHELDRVRDHLARHERGLHSLGSHRDAIGDRDRVELHRRPTGGPDAVLDLHAPARAGCSCTASSRSRSCRRRRSASRDPRR